MIPYGKQNITQDDIDAVTEVLKSDFLTQGPRIELFEKAFANYVGSKYAVCVSNGTAALHLSVLALGINTEEYVICTPLTFVASVNCVKYCGGQVYFADIDPDTYLISPEAVEKIIIENPDKKFRGVIPVDFAGKVVDLEGFNRIAKKYNLWVLEDSCHAPGGFTVDSKGSIQKAGNGKYTDASIFSFHPVKHIATGEGGMITTNDIELYNKLLKLRTHGITKNSNSLINPLEFASDNHGQHSSYPGWYMEMQELGYNYRLSDIQAALGISQLKRAHQGIEKRKKIAKKYIRLLKNSNGILKHPQQIEGHAFHLFVIEVENRRALYEYLKSKEIFCQIHYIPVHFMPYYKNLGWEIGDLPIVENYYKNCLSIPIFPTLEEDQINYIVETIKTFYSNEQV